MEDEIIPSVDNEIEIENPKTEGDDEVVPMEAAQEALIREIEKSEGAPEAPVESEAAPEAMQPLTHAELSGPEPVKPKRKRKPKAEAVAEAAGEGATETPVETDAPADAEAELVAAETPAEEEASSALSVRYTEEEALDFIPAIEALLFTAEHPVSIVRLKEVFGDSSPTEEQLAHCVATMQEKYRQPGFGFEVREAQGGFHFVTKIENSEYVRRFLATKPFRLGRSALETMAIIAYRQPVTRAEIDQVRGIDSSHLLRTLMERGLVKMAGKAEVPGRPVQYGTTTRFLEILGLKSLGELPPLTELDQLQGHTEDPAKALEDGLDKFMREKMTAADSPEDTEGLSEIESLIESVQKTPKEVYASPEHAEVAAENEAALQGFLAFMKPYRRRTPANPEMESANPTDAETDIGTGEMVDETTGGAELAEAPTPEAETESEPILN